MNAIAAPPAARSQTVTPAEVLNTSRLKVRELLSKTPSFKELPPAKQLEIAHNTVEILRYLAAPEGIPANTLAVNSEKPTASRALADDSPRGAEDEMTRSHFADVRKIGDSKFKAGAAREGAEVAGLLLNKVNFPTFVSGLIHGVFNAIVDSSIKQMEAYGKLVADIAKTLNQFRDENVTDNQGRDHLTEQFPDLFTLGSADTENGTEPRVRLRDGVDEDKALSRVNSLPIEGGPLKSLDLEDDDTENKLVQAARTQLATSRQQLLATMVLMGINRIVVTDGKISAKVLYDFQARDNRRLQRSAVAYDYARNQQGDVQTTTAGEGTYEGSTEGAQRSYSHNKDSSDYNETGANSYIKGDYKFSQQPIMTAMSAASESTDASLQSKASLAGVVEVNFKSETFPLDKMADSFQIGMIQNAAKPGAARAPAVGAAGTQQANASAPASGSSPAQPPAAQTPANKG